MSSSFIELSLFQFVLDFISVDLFFMFCCLSDGDYTDGVFLWFGECHNGKDCLENAYADPSIFAIFLSLVEECDHGMLKHRRNIQEINPMPADVHPILGFIPFVFHGSNVYTDSNYVKGLFSSARTSLLGFF